MRDKEVITRKDNVGLAWWFGARVGYPAPSQTRTWFMRFVNEKSSRDQDERKGDVETGQRVLLTNVRASGSGK